LKFLRQECFVFPAEGADGVVIGMGAPQIIRTGTLSNAACSMRRELKTPVA
jgi:hypothetical protein